MDENRYLISEAAKQVDIEAHVLRYWEEELQMDIPRNEMGHRYYTDKHLRMFCRIKELKEMGYQLKAIKEILEQEEGKNELSTEKDAQVVSHEFSAEEKMEQFHTVMTNIISQAIAANNENLSKEISSRVSERVMKEMNYCMRVQDERAEERFKRLDESLRAHQKNRKVRAEAAASLAPGAQKNPAAPSGASQMAPVVQLKKKRKGLFRKKQ